MQWKGKGKSNRRGLDKPAVLPFRSILDNPQTSFVVTNPPLTLKFMDYLTAKVCFTFTRVVYFPMKGAGHLTFLVGVVGRFVLEKSYSTLEQGEKSLQHPQVRRKIPAAPSSKEKKPCSTLQARRKNPAASSSKEKNSYSTLNKEENPCSTLKQGENSCSTLKQGEKSLQRPQARRKIPAAPSSKEKNSCSTLNKEENSCSILK